MTIRDQAQLGAARPDPVAAAIREHAHALGFHLARITDQLQHIADRLGDLTDTLDKERRP